MNPDPMDMLVKLYDLPKSCTVLDNLLCCAAPQCEEQIVETSTPGLDLPEYILVCISQVPQLKHPRAIKAVDLRLDLLLHGGG